jgi:hypothetical protein
VKLRDFPLLTDENLDPEVVAHLRQLGFDVVDVVESGRQALTTLIYCAWQRHKGGRWSPMMPISEPLLFIKTSPWLAWSIFARAISTPNSPSKHWTPS